MPVSDPHSQNFADLSAKYWVHIPNGTARLKEFLRTLVAQQCLTPISANRPKGSSASSSDSSDDPDRLGYLALCCQNALDAHTVEDAIFWHCEVMSELAARMQLSMDSARPPAFTAGFVQSLEEQLKVHNVIVNRLTNIVKRNGQFVWRP